jgi:26S proteasome regulatory subunit N11
LDPGFGCWLSSIDINMRQVHTIFSTTAFSKDDVQSLESLNSQSVAVVIDPIQSVKGKVVIDAFRLINLQTVITGREPHQTMSNIGHINKPSIQALIHGLYRHYYSIVVSHRKMELKQSTT